MRYQPKETRHPKGTRHGRPLKLKPHHRLQSRTIIQQGLRDLEDEHIAFWEQYMAYDLEDEYFEKEYADTELHPFPCDSYDDWNDDWNNGWSEDWNDYEPYFS